MKVSIALALLALASGSVWAREGGEVGNGGDSVHCEDTSDALFKGYFSLDYLLTLDMDGSTLANVHSWEESKARIVGLLREKYPDMARLLESYLSYLPIDDTRDPDRKYLEPRIWEESPFGLVDIKDERILRKLPPNCYQRQGDGSANIIQSVIRQKKGFNTVYSYDPAIYRELRERAPLQYSFLMIHEWLWDFTQDVQTVRRVNRLLHSSKLDKLSGEELRASLDHIDFGLNREFVPVCERTPAIRDALEKALMMPCDRIDEATLTNAQTELYVMNADLGTPAIGDFTGLMRFSRVILAGDGIESLYEEQFAPLTIVNTIDLSNNRLESVPARLFARNSFIGEINLSHNRLKSLPAGLFPKSFHTHQIDLSYNELETLPPGIFKGLTGTIFLGGNRFSAAEGQRIHDEYTAEKQLYLRW